MSDKGVVKSRPVPKRRFACFHYPKVGDVLAYDHPKSKYKFEVTSLSEYGKMECRPMFDCAPACASSVVVRMPHTWSSHRVPTEAHYCTSTHSCMTCGPDECWTKLPLELVRMILQRRAWGGNPRVHANMTAYSVQFKSQVRGDFRRRVVRNRRRPWTGRVSVRAYRKSPIKKGILYFIRPDPADVR